MTTADDHFQFTPSEIAVLRRHPAVLAVLMDHHEVRQAEAEAIWADEEGCPKGNEKRKQELLERGRSLMAEDLEIWPDALRRAFGFPASGTGKHRWHMLPSAHLPPRRDSTSLWSTPVWLALPDGTVTFGDCLLSGPNATHGHPVHAWFSNRCQLDADPVAWMPPAKPDHPFKA